MDGRMVWPDEGRHITDAHGRCVSDFDDGVAGAHGADDAIRRGTDQYFATSDGTPRISVRMPNR
jgi:hypothetical protein